MIILIRMIEIIGNHRYMKFSMLSVDADCCAAFGT